MRPLLCTITAVDWQLRAVCAGAVVGIAAAIGVPVVTFTTMKRAEDLAVERIQQVYEAQRAFRARGGRGGYATSVESLTTACPEGERAVLDRWAVGGYVLTVRAAASARPAGTDCHGRPTAGDFYAAARPAGPFAGRLAPAVTSRGRVFVFFDGVPPAEDDMRFGGLAVSLDALAGFKIP